MLHWKKVRIGLCAMILCFSLLPATAFAAGNTLTLYTKHNGTTFGLYQIADGENHLSDQFSNSHLDISSINYDLTQKLISYIRENQIIPEQEVKSQEDQAVFMNLSSGVYMIYGKSYLEGNTWYTPTPFTIDLNGSMEVNLKYDQDNIGSDTPEPPSPEPPDTTPQEPTPQKPEEDLDQDECTPPSSVPSNPNNNEPNNQTEDNSSDSQTRLPQTGQDWLTVLGTALSGSGLLLIGRKKKE